MLSFNIRYINDRIWRKIASNAEEKKKNEANGPMPFSHAPFKSCFPEN